MSAERGDTPGASGTADIWARVSELLDAPASPRRPQAPATTAPGPPRTASGGRWSGLRPRDPLAVPAAAPDPLRGAFHPAWSTGVAALPPSAAPRYAPPPPPSPPPPAAASLPPPLAWERQVPPAERPASAPPPPPVARDAPTRFEPLPARTFGPIRGPFDSLGRCLTAGLLSLLAIGAVVGYVLVDSAGSVCQPDCEQLVGLQRGYDVVSTAVIAITLYFVALYLVGLVRSRAHPPGPPAVAPFFVVVTPAHNEELVIGETVRRLLALEYDRYLAMVVNDGSSDRTSELARSAGAGDERLVVVDRDPSVAGVGKGDVLNHAYRTVHELMVAGDPRLDGATPDDVVICVVDADGWLRPDALRVVANYYSDPDVAGVQVPVRMYNARRGFLALMQDIEFIGFAVLLQGGRDKFGSVLLGGNGQFIRLRALDDLAPDPWSFSLVEDLDIGLSLVKHGWRNRMCPHTAVAQQAVSRTRPLLRQRTRWVQGHYAAWSHLPSLWRTRRIPLPMRIDLSLHLILAITILVVTAQGVIGLLGFTGVIALDGSLLARLAGDDLGFRLGVLVMACGPLSMLALAYQHAAHHYDSVERHRTPLWAIPGVYLCFVAYTYLWGVPASLRAFARLALGRRGWAKTARTALTPPPERTA